MAISTTNHRQTSFVDELLLEQNRLTAVEQFSRWQDANGTRSPDGPYQKLIPLSVPRPGEQYAFEVNLDKCSGCKACVTACHSLNGLDEGETWRSVGLLISNSEFRNPRAERKPKFESRNSDFSILNSFGLRNSEFGFQQHITTACHHCVEPGCLNGCPVLAYDKDPITGIVKHLDDQCIGCQYCVFKCPYDVPKYSASRGIVRKCDMCAGRLAVGEAPACVQACPHEAIRITVVEQGAVRSRHAGQEVVEAGNGANGSHPSPLTPLPVEGRWEPKAERGGGMRSAEAFTAVFNSFLPAAPEPRWTLPTTRYVTKRELSASLLAADIADLKPEHGHGPLVIMLVLTQMAVGGFVMAALLGGASARWLIAFSFAVLVAGLVSSTLHLGRPLKAWRAFLGLRRSWLSREIVVFGLLPPLAATALAGAWLPEVVPGAITKLATISAAIVGLAGVFCSGMIYHDTPRESWHGGLSVGRFFATTAMLGMVAAWLVTELAGQGGIWLPVLLAIVGAVKLARELALTRKCPDDAPESGLPLTNQIERCAYLMRFVLGGVWRARLACGWAGCVVLPLAGALRPSGAVWLAALSLLLCLSGELLERSLFFRAVASPRMPGGVGA